MSTYTIRVELHSDVYSDFETLHSAMQREGFSQLITSDDGITYHLPRAEYNISTTKNRSQVLEATKQAVQSTGETAEILVTESLGRTWHNLTKKS